MLHSRGRSFILDWISVWSLEDHSTRYGCKLWRVPWTMFWSSCAGGRSCWGTRRLNCGYEDLAISSSTQPTCCTAQRTMSEVSCIDATRSPFSPVITPLTLTNKGLIECRREKKSRRWSFSVKLFCHECYELIHLWCLSDRHISDLVLS